MNTRNRKSNKVSVKQRKTPSSLPLAIKHKDYLTLLSKAAKNPTKRNKLIDVADTSEIRAVSECIKNILEGNVPLSKKHLNQMKRHKLLLRSLAKRCYPVKKKKTILKQKGGFIGALIPMAISALSGMLPSLLKGLTE